MNYRATILAGLLFWAMPADARLLTIQSQGLQATTSEGSATLDEYNRAEIQLTVLTSTGEGLSQLSPEVHLGNERSIIELPEGWRLTTTLVPAGGCFLKPTHLYNAGEGFYTVSVMTHSDGAPCEWRAGDYGYVIQISGYGWAGVALGKISITRGDQIR